MQDREMVTAIEAGEPAGLAAAYDRYAAPLYAYCRTLVAEPADAADAVQDTFVIAAAKLGGLRDPDRLRPWLYAVARNECQRRLRARLATPATADAGTAAPGDAVQGADAERAQLGALAGLALAGLDPAEREVIELTVRHQLTGPDLADTLGLGVPEAHALASRARARFETSLGVLQAARSGRESCPALAAIVHNWDGRLTGLLRKRVSRHIQHCQLCAARIRREPSPAMLLGMRPAAPFPAGLREQVLTMVADPGPAGAGYRDRVIRRAGQFAPSGFPEPVAAPRPGGKARAYALPAAVVVLFLVAVGAGIVVAADLFQHHAPPAAAGVTGGPSAQPAAPAKSSRPATEPATAPVAATPTASVLATASSSPSARHLARPTASPSVSPSSSPSPTPDPSPSPSPSVTPGVLAQQPSRIVLTRKISGGPYTGSFKLTAEGGPVAHFTISNPHPRKLAIVPSHGSLAAGQSVRVHLVVVHPLKAYISYLIIRPGSLAVTVYYPPAG